jgi:hypothetical protein
MRLRIARLRAALDALDQDAATGGEA